MVLVVLFCWVCQGRTLDMRVVENVDSRKYGEFGMFSRITGLILLNDNLPRIFSVVSFWTAFVLAQYPPHRKILVLSRLLFFYRDERNIYRPPCPCPPCRQVIVGKGPAEARHVCFFSLRNIRAGEEIFYAYPAPHTVGLGEVIAPDCACRAPGCRGRISQREDPFCLF